ncbi:MAG: fatty acid desaturase [Pseudomonadota bacterium]
MGPALTTADLAARSAARDRQTVIGVGLATTVIGAWIVAHILAVYVVDWAALPIVAPVLMIAVQTWLFTGLFIIAHDCMHGSLAPGRPPVNRWFGRVALFLYAAFHYDRLLPEHHKHHRRPGTAEDPDFNADNPYAFWPWFARFMRHYYTWREFVSISVAMTLYVVVLGPPVVNIILFYAIPGILSAFQLFYFGTYRPHRHEAAEFLDDHRSRTDDFSWPVSLLTCFHFGYHHEHHLSPTTPWWRLPAVHRAQKGLS